ncbi:hypothetical protein V496_09865 [Pseudogymnoascus sp. VKM F-4515 (FW-2607)]|nr:hypothetical protein V496_09865 [Pseudogymnoascus sp. VKM F-4515 (FW-2607)]KFY86998.1 hypothetical protein V498_07322 [Pseudogymnoascus sp. VKM F-4517 (FW-2822)]
MVTVAVAGRTGGIGRAIVEAITEGRKHKIIVLARKSEEELAARLGAPIIAVDYYNVPELTQSLKNGWSIHGETGLPLSDPENNTLQPENTDGPQQGQSEDEHESNVGYKPTAYSQLRTAAEKEPRWYMSSKPMNDSSARNISLHDSINRLLDGEQPIFDDLIIMRESIDYRMNQVMGAATMYNNFWDIDMPDCHEVDVEALFISTKIIKFAFDLVCRFDLFDKPSAFQGYIYVKRHKYIACCINRAGWDYDEAVAKLEMLLRYGVKWYYRTTIPIAGGTSRVTAMARRIMSDYEDVIRVELEKTPPCMKLKILTLSSKSNPPRKGILERSVEGRSRDAAFWEKFGA